MVGASTRIPIVGPLAGEFVGKKITEFGTNPERLSMKAIGAFNKAKGQSVWGKGIQKGVNALNKEYTPVDKAVKEAGKQINKLPADQRGFAKLPFVGDKPSQKEVLNSVIKKKTADNVSETLYHGTQAKEIVGVPKTSEGKMGNAFYLTKDKQKAISFGKEKNISDDVISASGKTIKRTLREPNAYKTSNVFEFSPEELKIKTVSNDKEFFDMIPSGEATDANATFRLMGYDGVYNNDTGTYAIYNTSKLKPKTVVDPLIQEAKKYKTAEEFVKAQPTYYRGEGGSNVAQGKALLAEGKHLASDAEYPKGFGKVGEYVIKPDIKVLDLGDSTFSEISKKLGIPERRYISPKELSSIAKEKGYGVLKYKGEYKSSVKQFNHIVDLTGDSTITKSQLTDIFNKANK
jgi:hypothetical protein